MALDIHALNLLRFASKSGADFSSVLTFGRLGLWLSDEELARYFAEAGPAWNPAETAAIRGDGFCESFLKRAFSAGEVASLDGSPYEGATLIHDMNLPLSGSRQFSAVMDFGALEHVFNLPVALSNLITACRDGGHLLHALPANNWCGHGFYQFSPELFFSVYSERRGFQGTQVFLVETNRPFTWYRVRSPLESGKRVQVVNREKTLILVLTRKTSHAQLPMHAAPQQSDYAIQWTEPTKDASPRTTAARERRRRFTRATGLSTLARAIRQPLRGLRSYLFGHKERLRGTRRDMDKVDVAALVAR
jgi:SAM-dependent methyltransferase